jgi:uncharacterized surface protein with fasciclin (FAS1) repeats
MRRKLSTILAAALAMTLVAVPATADEDPFTIVDAVQANDGEFDVLEAAVLAVEGAGVLPAATLLSTEGAFTVFAPTDKAFEKLAEDLSGLDFDSDDEVIGWLVGNLPIETIAAVLAYHVVDSAVVPFAVDSATVVTLDAAPMLLKDADDENTTVGIFTPGKAKAFRSIQFVDNDPDARNPKLVKGLFDIEVDNGIIHGIDRVLRPIDL